MAVSQRAMYGKCPYVASVAGALKGVVADSG
jgi:hypothetical protein